MSVFHNNALIGAGAGTGAAAAAGYVIPKSLRFNSGDSASLSKTFAATGNRRTWTWSAWVKRSGNNNGGLFGNYYSDDSFGTLFFNSDQLQFSANTTWFKTTQVFRDFSSFFHIVLAVDTTLATAGDRVRLYINGSEVTDFATENNPSQNANLGPNNSAETRIGRDGSNYFNGLLADIQFVDGQQLAPTDFGETRSSDGVWVPKEFTRTSPNNGTTWSSLVSNADSSYPATNLFDGSLSTYAEGTNGGGDVTFSGGTISGTTIEFYGGKAGSSTFSVNGVDKTSLVPSSSGWFTITGVTSITAFAFNRGGPGNYVDLFAIRVDGEILLDGLNNSSGYGRNGFHLNFSDSSTNEALGFDSAPTTPDPDPKKGMDVITYTGNGGTQNIGGLNFEPGLVWIKERSGTDSGSANHVLVDSVRGSTKTFYPNLTAAETTGTVAFKSFNPDGFTLGLDTTKQRSNDNNDNYVAWTWRAGGPAVSNSDGTITSQVSANTDYGFSIVTYSGTGTQATVGHGLGATPKFIIVKRRDSTGRWAVYYDGMSTGDYIYLDLTDATANDSAGWPALPTSSLFTISTNSNWNNSSGTYVAYCWSEVSGYSKFSSYSGTGSSGNAITTGFKPKFVLIKHADGAHGWYLYDSERSNGNAILEPNSSGAEYSGGNSVVFNDNGFTVDATSADLNTSGDTYIYAAFADRPGNNWDVNNIVTNEGLTTSKTQFDVVTYTGDGQSTKSIDSLAFQPDLVWLKSRSNNYDHELYDSVRGATKRIYSNATDAEATFTNGLTAFDSSGFTLGSRTNVNANNATYVAWCWKAGGTAVSNTDGSITSSVSANAQYGFSIVTFTTSTAAFSVGHGLSTTPKLVIHKDRDNAYIWTVYHADLGPDKYLTLNSTAAATTSSGQFGSGPTDSVVNFSSGYANNNDGVCYCFANVPGYQRIGSYTGNGSTTGPVVVTGFKPRFLLIKNTSLAGSNWFIFDSERSPSNPVKLNLKPNSSAVEETDSSGTVDFNENGFQIKSAGTHPNGSGNTIIYLAIGDDEIGSDEDCLVDVPNAVTADADATDTTGGYQRGNYATLNPLDKESSLTLSNGNLDVSNTANSLRNSRATIAYPATGKWYYEYTPSGSANMAIGIADSTTSLSAENSGTFVTYHQDGAKNVNGTKTASAFASYTAGDVIGVLYDSGANSLTFYKNGSSQGSVTPTSGTTYFPFIITYNTTGSFNFGQQRFKYPIPSGYAALNTTALPAATIEDGSAYFDVVTYTGNGNSTRTITNIEFSPDLVWTKARNQAYGQNWYDIVRTAGKVLRSDLTDAEATNHEHGYLSAFNSDGYTMSAGTTSSKNGNELNTTYVGWLWDAGSSTVSNTDGSVTSSVRANQSAGFSIIGYTGTGSALSIGHGLNATPTMFIQKNRSSSEIWRVYYTVVDGSLDFLRLNTTGSKSDSSNSLPTSSVIHISGTSGDDYIVYAFTPVAGYSAFGSYEGNGSATDGPFVHTGFRVVFLMIKRTDSTGDWFILDGVREPFNYVSRQLGANNSGAESGPDVYNIDFTSNGFKLRNSNAGFNASAGSYLYLAFAENPFQANGGLAR